MVGDAAAADAAATAAAAADVTGETDEHDVGMSRELAVAISGKLYGEKRCWCCFIIRPLVMIGPVDVEAATAADRLVAAAAAAAATLFAAAVVP